MVSDVKSKFSSEVTLSEAFHSMGVSYDPLQKDTLLSTYRNHCSTLQNYRAELPTLVDVWLEGGSIYIMFKRDANEYIETNAKVVIGIKNNELADIEILLDKEGIVKLEGMLRPYGNRK